MEPVTHGLASVLVGALWSPPVKGRGLAKLSAENRVRMYVALAGGLAPDLDYVLSVLGMGVHLLVRRGPTHSLIALPVIAAAVALGAGGKGKKAWEYFGIAASACALHLLMDLMSAGGVRLLYPMDSQFYSYGLLNYLDPWLLVVLGAGAGLLWRMPVKADRRVAAALVLVVMFGYMGVCGTLKDRAMEMFRLEKQTQALRSVTSLPGSPLRWWAVSTDAQGRVDLSVIDLFAGRVYVHDTLEPRADTPVVKGTEEIREVRDFMAMARYAYPTIGNEQRGNVVTWRELAAAWLPWRHQVLRITVDADGNVMGKDYDW